MRNLKEKWKVNNLQMFLILCTFAIGGSLCGYVGRKLLVFANIENKIIYYILYILLITFLWPIAVIFVSLVTGQFNFFKNYLLKIRKRIFGK